MIKILLTGAKGQFGIAFKELLKKNYYELPIKIFDPDRNELDMVYLTTTSKNPFLINFLKTNFINIIGTDGISDDLIKMKFHYFVIVGNSFLLTFS